jgi:hypothetical protein
VFRPNLIVCLRTCHSYIAVVTDFTPCNSCFLLSQARKRLKKRGYCYEMLIREWSLDNSVNIERPSQCTNRHSDSSNIIDHLRVNIICERDACGRMRRRVRELGLELELVVHSWSW